MIHIYIDHASIFSCSFPGAPFFCGLCGWNGPTGKHVVETWWERHVYAAGGVFNTMILLWMGPNLINFVLSVDGAHWSGIRFLFVTCALFVGSQPMFEYWEEELRDHDGYNDDVG
ncbi:hypothetical protein BGW80DRAFT_1354467, partial [Lactifluus volemus]